MAQYANQKTIHTNRDVPTFGAKRVFTSVYNDVLFDAMENISTVGALKVYLYLLSNSNDYHFDFSPKYVSDKTGLSVGTVKKSINELVEKRYVVKDESGYFWNFYEKPQEEKKKTHMVLPKQEQRLAEQDDGTFKPMTYVEVYNELKDSFPEEMIKQIWNDLEVFG